MKEDKDTRVVEVFTGSPWEAEFIKGLLESNGIESILKDGGGLAALAPYYIGQEIAVLVNEDDYENAMEIVRNRERQTNKFPRSPLCHTDILFQDIRMGEVTYRQKSIYLCFQIVSIMKKEFTRIAIKVGSNVLTRQDGTLDVTRMSALTDQIAALHKAG